MVFWSACVSGIPAQEKTMNNDGYRKNIFKIARSQGWVITMSDHHVKLIAPNGLVIVTSSTSSDWRAAANMLSRMRQLGFQMPTFKKSSPSSGATKPTRVSESQRPKVAPDFPKRYRIIAHMVECVYRDEGLTYRILRRSIEKVVVPFENS
jgi:hypothetical protein